MSSSKSDYKEERIFNGGSIVDWIIIRDAIELEADRLSCKYQLAYQETDIVGGAVLEAIFTGQRVCAKGQEQEFVDRSIDEQIEDVRLAAVAKRQRIDGTNYGNTAAGAVQKEKDRNLVDDKESDDVNRLKQSKFKLVMDAQAGGARHDNDVRQFDADKAKAIGILRKFLGPNPKNNIAKELSELRPRAAWKKLSDIYASDAATAGHLNNTTNLMSGLIFDKKFGDVIEHMGVLDRLNETLIAAGRGKSDAELMNYLLSAMERSKDGAMYKTTLDVLTVLNKLDRTEILEALRAVEQKAKNAAALKGNHTIAGARFGKADVAFAGAVAVGKKRKRAVANSAGDSKAADIVCFKCCKKGHRARDCTIDIVCGFCNRTNHCEDYCWEKDPSKRSSFMRANAVLSPMI
jgi:hypothetical protein